MLLHKGHRVEVVDNVIPEDILSINTPQQLDIVESVLQARVQTELEQAS